MRYEGLSEREKKLPKWTQRELTRLREELVSLHRAHVLLQPGRDWFTIPGPAEHEGTMACRHLFYLHQDGAHPACSLYQGDVLLVGRDRPWKMHRGVPREAPE